MRASPVLAVIAALLVSATTLHAAEARFVGRYQWVSDAPFHGGYSGLELSGDGTGFVAISDRGRIVTGTLRRTSGAVTGVDVARRGRIRTSKGAPVDRENADAEGLAGTPGGPLYIAFEANHRVMRHADPWAPAEFLPRPDAFRRLQNNSGLEALAIDDRGRLYTLPERSGNERRPFPVYRYDGRRWTVPMNLPRRDGFLPVGADFDDRGRFYLLERNFRGIFGFSSRVRRFSFDGDRIAQEEILFTSRAGQHDNLEGLAVWRDSAGAIGLTMVSDDNFQPFQVTEFVDYRVAD